MAVLMRCQVLCSRQLAGQLIRFMDQDREMLRANPIDVVFVLELDQGHLLVGALAHQAMAKKGFRKLFVHGENFITFEPFLLPVVHTGWRVKCW